MPAPAGKGVISHWVDVETTAPMDVFTARDLVDQVAQKLGNRPLW